MIGYLIMEDSIYGYETPLRVFLNKDTAQEYAECRNDPETNPQHMCCVRIVEISVEE